MATLNIRFITRIYTEADATVYAHVERDGKHKCLLVAEGINAINPSLRIEKIDDFMTTVKFMMPRTNFVSEIKVNDYRETEKA